MPSVCPAAPNRPGVVGADEPVKPARGLEHSSLARKWTSRRAPARPAMDRSCRRGLKPVSVARDKLVPPGNAHFSTSCPNAYTIAYPAIQRSLMAERIQGSRNQGVKWRRGIRNFETQGSSDKLDSLVQRANESLQHTLDVAYGREQTPDSATGMYLRSVASISCVSTRIATHRRFVGTGCTLR